MNERIASALILLFVAAACGESAEPSSTSSGGTSSSGGSGSGSGGTPNSGGSFGSGGFPTGGAPTGGTGGSPATGGGTATGGTTSSGGASSGGTAGASAGTGGAGTGGSAGSTGSGGSGGGSGCPTGEVAPSEVILIGDSFIAANHGITIALQELAREAGVLGPSETYREVAVSGTTLANGQIASQYNNAVSASPVKVVLMDGGGNDCLLQSNAAGAIPPAEALFESMKNNGTETVVYFFYPDPVGNTFPHLKGCLDTLRPQMKDLCESLTSPKCYFIDLRPVWQGHENEYVIQDGIHPTMEGGAAVARAVWDVMQENCIAQ